MVDDGPALKGDRPYAYFLRGTSVAPIEPWDAPAVDLPDSLVIRPGNYRVQGLNYALNKEGLYRFLCPFPLKDNQQRIVFAGDAGTLVSSLCWLASHGSQDDHLTNDELMQKAMTDKVIITCGNKSLFCADMLRRQGIPARAINVFGLGEPNSFDMAHVVVEAFIEGKWTLFDVDANLAFRYQGKRLSLVDAVDHFEKDDYELERLSLSTYVAIGSFAEDGYDYSLYMETGFSSEEMLRRWYHRTMQFPVMSKDGSFYFLQKYENKAGARALMQLMNDRGLGPVVALPEGMYLKKFYPELMVV